MTNMIEDYKDRNKLYNRRSESYYTMTERNGNFYQRRHQIGPDGREVNALEERIDYVIGSGDQARSYLHRNSEGRLIELLVSWSQLRFAVDVDTFLRSRNSGATASDIA